jgi:nitrite reductase/ring-hydroxylating ferredoxin subunit
LSPTRRDLLRAGLALAVLPACGPGKDTGAADSCATRDGTDGWWPVPLADLPEELLHEGGSAPVQLPKAFLDVVVIHQPGGCYTAVWRDCTHGACRVAYDAASRELVCPCHDSRFGEDGAVRQGPATEPLRTFSVAREGEMLWIHRPM